MTQLPLVRPLVLVAVACSAFLTGCGDDAFFSTDPVKSPPPHGGDSTTCPNPDKVCKLASSTPGYPACGCGTEVGDVIDNYLFQGKDAGEGGTAAPKRDFRPGTFFDATGAKNRYLALGVAGLWCIPCGEEANDLPRLKLKFGSRGVFFMTDVAENSGKNPSTDANLDTWITAHKLNTIVVNDPDFVLGRFFNKTQMPLNMIIDLKTMIIVDKFTGADTKRIESYLDAHL
jgi:hypothetical protein